MRVLVTGGSGFIGGHLIEALAGMGAEILAPVRTGRNLQLACAGHVKVVETDLTNRDQVRGLAKRIDTVYHLASIRGSGWSYSDEAIRWVNVEITRNLLEASVMEGVGHFIYISSVSAFGHPQGGPIHENYPCSPATRYGKSKYESENLVENFRRTQALRTTTVRPVITYGPGDTWGMIPKLVRLMRSGTYMTVGTGKNRVHLIYIDDLVDGLILASEQAKDGAGPYILAGDEPISINRLVEIIAREIGREAPRIKVPLWFARMSAAMLETGYKLFQVSSEPFLTRDKIDVMCRDRFFDSGKAKRDFGFSPMITYEVGVQKTVGWLRSSNQI